MPGDIELSAVLSILDATSDGIVAVDADGRITVVNRAAEAIFGINAGEVLGKPATGAIADTRLHEVLTSGQAEHNQPQRLGNATVNTSRIPIKDGSGQTVGAVAILRDTTELEALSAKVSDLWQARTLLEAVIDAIEDAISVADEAGNNIIVNQAYTRITGLPRESVINKPATVDIAEGESMHMKVISTGKSVKNVRLKVGPAKREVIVNVAPIFIDGEIRGSVGVIHDISEIIFLTAELTRTKNLLRHLKAKYGWEDIIGTSPAIERAKEQAVRAAGTQATVLLLGESGTGKELFAHAIHNGGGRAEGKFVSVNCTTLAEGLLESELFGYEDGAFTGARAGGRKGLFEEAGGGTIFLDEIGEISPALQLKLLRVLQEKEIVRVGGSTPTVVDCRVIAATNVDLDERVGDGSFRKDLYYRLYVVPISIPPLKERRQDIPAISEHILYRLNPEFGRQVAEVSAGALEVLGARDWPGNIRELENVLGRAMLGMGPKDRVLGAEHLVGLEPGPEGPAGPAVSGTAAGLSLHQTLEAAERAAVAGALKAAAGNRTRAARNLGISLRSLYYKISRHGLK